MAGEIKSSKNKILYKIMLPGGRVVHTIPDAVCGSHGIVECKDVSYLANSNQLRAQMELAKQQGTRFTLVISPRTRVSQPLLDELDKGKAVLMRFDLETKELVEVPIESLKHR